MTTLGTQHPGDASRFVPLGELFNEIWGKLQAAAALVEQQAQSVIDHDVQFQVLAERIDGLHSSLAGMVSRLDTLTGRVAALEGDERVAELAAHVTLLEARIKALEPQTGPAFGVDVSGHQTIAQVQAVAADPVNAFVVIKATEGMGGRNADYTAQRAAVGTKFLGAYHFAWSNQDPLKEAANFLTNAALKPGDLAFLDVENWGTGTHPTPEMQATSWAQRVTFALAWLDEVKAKTGATPLVYANWDWIKGLRSAATVAQWERLAAYPLWLAQWTNTAGQHDTVSAKTGSDKGWPVALHQYGVIDNLDRNWTPDLAALRKLGAK